MSIENDELKALLSKLVALGYKYTGTQNVTKMIIKKMFGRYFIELPECTLKADRMVEVAGVLPKFASIGYYSYFQCLCIDTNIQIKNE
jgi:hypothetical protein